MPALLLWLLVAFIVGVLAEWLLEIFFFRKRMFARIEGLEATARAREAERDQARTRGDKLQADLDACATARAKLDQERTALQARALQLQADIDASAAARAKLEQELNLAQAQVQQLQSDLDAGVKAQAARESDLRHLRAELDDHKAHQTQLVAELDDHKTQKAQLVADVTELTAGAAATAATIKALEGDKGDLTARLAQLQANLDATAQALTTREGELHQVRTELDAQKASNSQLQTELDAATCAKTDWEKESAGLKVQLSKANAYLQAHVQSRAELESELNALKEHVGQKDAELEIGMNARMGLEQDLLALKTQWSQANADLAACAGARAELEKQHAGLQARVDGLAVELDAATKSKSELQARVDGLAGELDATAKAKAALDAEYQAVARERAELQARADGLANELDTAVKGKAALDGEYQASQVELGRLRADLDIHKTQQMQLAADHEASVAGAATALATIQQLESDKVALRAQIDTLVADLARVSAERDQSSVELEGLRAQPVFTPKPGTAFAAMQERSADDETPFTAACPQHLSDVRGIGSVFEQRLYEAGIGSYWMLSRQSNDDLHRILKLTHLQAEQMDLNAVRADALRLAKETKSLGREWSCEPPDDFEPMGGIGHTYEKRLYDAGICTYEALASATVEFVEQICHAPARFKPDYAAWIEQAKVLAAQKKQRANG